MSLICPICHRLSYGGWTHQQCKTKYGLDRFISLYEYDGWAKKIIKNVKFGQSKIYRALSWLSSEFACGLKGLSSRSEDSPYELSAVLIPVPLHWYRQLKRGLNQSSLIAQALGRGLNIPVNEKILKRVRHTEPQTLVSSSLRLSASGGSSGSAWQSNKVLRLKNIRGAFSIRPGLKGPTLKTARKLARPPLAEKVGPYEVSADSVFLLVDDVWTTGITLTECCRVLKRAGARQVWALTLLRTL